MTIFQKKEKIIRNDNKIIKRCCPICKTSINLISYSAKEMYLGSNKFFEYLHCQKCYSFFIEQIPEDLDEYYGNYHSFKEKKKKSKWKRSLEKTIKRSILSKNIFLPFAKLFINRFSDGYKIKTLSRVKLNRNSKILDVGSGGGDFIKTLHYLGYSNALGIDPYLKKDIHFTNGGKVLKTSLFDIDGKFDVITFHHAFEHMLDPIQTAKQIKKLLALNGIAIIRMPNINSYSFRFFRGCWQGIHPPFHICLPSDKGMERLFKPLGLNIIDIKQEQILEFFLMSREIYLNIPQNQNNSTLYALLDKKKNKLIWHSSKEINYWKKMVKHVKKKNICDHICYYVTNI